MLATEALADIELLIRSRSMCARAMATKWGLPLLRLDTGSLYNKFIGETENNFRRAMRSAERLAPCVLFIDELEKAFASGGTEDGGVSMRVLGTFLTWLQERKADVHTAFSDGAALSSEHLLREAAVTRPLSIVVAEKIAALRTWAGERTVPAN